MDDILIYMNNISGHCLLVFKVLYRLLENGLAADIKKCVFEEKKIELLGYIYFESGVGMVSVKVKAITKCEPPKTVNDI